jgi:hypothetical protein
MSALDLAGKSRQCILPCSLLRKEVMELMVHLLTILELPRHELGHHERSRLGQPVIIATTGAGSEEPMGGLLSCQGGSLLGRVLPEVDYWYEGEPSEPVGGDRERVEGCSGGGLVCDLQ